MLAENLQPSFSEIILPKECLTLSPDCQEGVKDVLGRLQRMKEKGSWFKVKTPEELNSLIPQVQEHAQGIFDGLRQYKNADNSWDAARGAALCAAWDAARGTSWDAAREAVGNAARVTAWDAAREATGGAARNVAWNTAWHATGEVVKYLPCFETNPFSRLLSLYELGSAGIKFHQVEETAGNEEPEEMLIVHFPLKLEDDRPVLACLAFPDGRTGDETVQYIHSWQDPCSEITLLNTLPQRKIK